MSCKCYVPLSYLVSTGLYACNCIFLGTRLHSSKMRTARALTVSPSMLCRRGVPGPRGVYLVPGGVYLVWGGLPGLGGCTWSGGVPSPGGAPGQVLPPCGQTHACKLITLPQTSFAGGNKPMCYF